MYVSHEDYLHKQAMASMVSGVPSHDPLVRHVAGTMYGEAAGFINHPQVQPAYSTGTPSSGGDGDGVLAALILVGSLFFLL